MSRYISVSGMVVICLALTVACDEKSPVAPEEPGWASLGFEDHWAVELELDWPDLYACAADEGLFRMRLTTPGLGWQYLGLADTSLADTTFGHYLNRGVLDVVVLEAGAIIAGVTPGIISIPKIYRSSDDGASWQPSGTCLPGSNDPCIRGGIHQLRRSPCDARVVIAGSTLPLYRSATEGSTWIHVWGRTATGLGVRDIEFHSRECNIVYAGGENSWFFPFLVKSVDHGITWEQIYFGDIISYDNQVYSIAMHPVDADVVYLGMMKAVLKTIDGGATWTSGAFSSCASGNFRNVAIDGENPLHMFASCGASVLESWDGGETCDDIGDPIQSLILDMDLDSRRGNLYVGTMEGVFRYKWR